MADSGVLLGSLYLIGVYMFEGCSIITVGVCPCWDVVCSGVNIDWGSHGVVSHRRVVAGKAFNVSRAMAQMGKRSVASGLWGAVDFSEMSAAAQSLTGFVDLQFTKAAGRTRDNITVIDEGCGREMHLRAASDLASVESLGQLENDLCGMVDEKSICVFAGSMPGGELSDRVISVIESARECGGKIVIDTSGEMLDEIVDRGGIEILKPNLAELSELLGVNVADNPTAIAWTAKTLLDRAKTIVVTRGEKGAVVVTKDSVLQGRCVTKNKIVSTVGCGDYFLAGFLCGDSLEESLAKGLKAAASRAWGWSEKSDWSETENKIEVEIQ
jgi:fructose-1-phosphate kinase PfkB-like protein